MKSSITVFLMISCSAGSVEGDKYIEENVFSTLRVLMSERVVKEDKTINVAIASFDLDGDNEPEVFAYVSGQSVCGSGGCLLYILKKNKEDYRQVTKLTITKLPIQVFGDKSYGWLDLGVFVQGGGINPGHNVMLRFNGKTYPSNPSLEPKASSKTGKVIISSLSPARPLFK